MNRIAFRRPAMIASLAAGLGFPQAFANWPQYHGPNTNNTIAENVSIADWGNDGPKTLWKIETDTGFSSFAVADGAACTLVREEIDGLDREVVLAVDAASGKKLWSAPLTIARYGHDGGNAGEPGNSGGDGPRSTPSLDSGKVYVTDADLNVYCFDAKTGEVVWTRDLEKDHDANIIKWKNAASPLIVGDLVILAGGGSGQALLGLDKSTGRTVWAAEDDTMTHATPVFTEIHGVPQVVFFTQDGLVAVRPEDGTALWRQNFPFSVSTAASPVVWNDIVFCSAGYGVGGGAYRITRSGLDFKAEEIWRTPNENSNHWSTPVVSEGGYLYGMFSFKEYGAGPIACIDIRTGEMQWSKEGFGAGNLVLAGDTLIALSDRGELVVIEPSPEEYIEKQRADILDGKVWSTPAVADGKVFARSTKEGVCVDLGG